MSRVCVVGAGGREHALAWRLTQDADVVVTPGSDGMRAAGLECTSASPIDLAADLFVVGPEVPLIAGLADALRGQGKAVFGPGAAGAQLEGSKSYMKELCDAANVPTAAYGCFREVDHAVAMLHAMSPPYVIKTDGFAAGKGVLVTQSLDEAERDVADKLSGQAFGEAGASIVIEEGLVGVECSFFVLSDGVRAAALPCAHDYKQVGDGNTGPNTGGMGAVAPMGYLSADFGDQVMTTIIEPTMRELRRRDIDYRGVFYAGLMVTTDGPKLLEYNVRFGDPETQALMALIAGDFAGLLSEVANGAMTTPPMSYGAAAVTVVLATRDYPRAPHAGDVITGLAPNGQLEAPFSDVTVFHAGTRLDESGRFVTSGGRVLGLTATGPSVRDARERAYRAAATVTFEGRVLRTDIGSEQQ